MQNNKNKSDNHIVLPHSNRIQWVAVGHTRLHIYNKTDNQIYGMILNAQKTGKFFSRKLVQFFNGRKGLSNSSHPNNPLIISHLHTGKLNNTSSTIHYHFAFGNIPTVSFASKKVVSEKKSDYEVYHKSYTSAINAARDYAEKKGYEINDDDAFRQIGMGPRKPSEGKTNKFSIELSKDGKVQRKKLQIQVYGMRNSYELNAYIQ